MSFEISKNQNQRKQTFFNFLTCCSTLSVGVFSKNLEEEMKRSSKNKFYEEVYQEKFKLNNFALLKKFTRKKKLRERK